MLGQWVHLNRFSGVIQFGFTHLGFNYFHSCGQKILNNVSFPFKMCRIRSSFVGSAKSSSAELFFFNCKIHTTWCWPHHLINSENWNLDSFIIRFCCINWLPSFDIAVIGRLFGIFFAGGGDNFLFAPWLTTEEGTDIGGVRALATPIRDPYWTVLIWDATRILAVIAKISSTLRNP